MGGSHSKSLKRGMYFVLLWISHILISTGYISSTGEPQQLVATIFDTRALEDWVRRWKTTDLMRFPAEEVFKSIGGNFHSPPCLYPSPRHPRTTLPTDTVSIWHLRRPSGYRALFSCCMLRSSSCSLLGCYSALNFSPLAFPHWTANANYCLPWYLFLSKKMKAVIRFALSTRCSSEITYWFWQSSLPNCWGVIFIGVI